MGQLLVCNALGFVENPRVESQSKIHLGTLILFASVIRKPARKRIELSESDRQALKRNKISADRSTLR